MKPYDKYKDSGIEWIGSIPSSWNISKFKHLAKIRNGKDQKPVEIEEGGYPVLGTGGGFGRASEFLYDKPSVLLGRKGTIDKPQYVEEPFWTVDTLFYTEIKEDCIPRFVYYLSLTIPFQQLQESSAVPSMTQEKLHNVFLCKPSLYEQIQIAKYLDHQTAIIDELIAQKEQLITLLKQKRQAVINEAVTKGLNPNAKMKDSGIEWLGQVPENWKLVKFKYIAKIRNGKDQKPVEIEEGGYPVLGTGGEFGRASEYLYDKPSVLLGRKGTIDKPQYVEEPFWTVDTLFYTEIRENCIPLFVFYLCQQIPFQLLQESSAVPSMTQDNLNNVFLCKPSLEEQNEICSYLQKKTNDFDILIEKSTKQIENLKEYRQSLISEAVTGKIDLRDWQPNE